MFAPLLLKTEAKGKRVPVAEGAWFALTVRSEPSGVDGEFAATTLSLGPDGGDDGLPLWWSVDSAVPPSRGELATLRRLAEVDDVEPEILDSPERRGRDAAAVAVYDVGQGSFSAIVDEFEHPVMFIDLGWPLPGLNSKSCPVIPTFDPFVFDCEERPAPVVLSHFDWDHWGYAWLSGRAVWDSTTGAWKNPVIYRQRALARPWLVRRPKLKRHELGASHIHFIQKLRSTLLPDNTRALKIYPGRRSSIPYGPATVIRCSSAWSKRKGSSFLRNNEGLAVHLSNNELDDDKRQVLYCGDAEFGSIALKYRTELTGVVAPHHGGKIEIGDMPTPAAIGINRVMAVSTFTGCYPSVPHAGVEKAALAKGWSWEMTETRNRCPRGHCVRGNLHLPLAPSLVRCQCGRVDASCLCLT